MGFASLSFGVGKIVDSLSQKRDMGHPAFEIEFWQGTLDSHPSAMGLRKDGAPGGLFFLGWGRLLTPMSQKRDMGHPAFEIEFWQGTLDSHPSAMGLRKDGNPAA